MTKFTEGEWEVANGLLVGEQVLFIHVFGKQVLCRLTKQVDTTPLTEEDVANAHLMAAAPEMYELLEDFVDFCDRGDPEGFYQMHHVAKKLLVKARGEL